MKKMKYFGAVILVSVLLFTGCNADLEGSNSGSNGGNSVELVFNDSTPTTVDGEQTAVPEKIEAGICTVNRNCFTEEDLFKLFGGDQEKVEKNEKNGSVTYSLGDASGYIQIGGLYYYTEDGNNFDSAQSLTRLEDTGAYKEYTDESTGFDFASREEAKECVLSALEKLGYSSEKIDLKSQYSVKSAAYDFYKKEVHRQAEEDDSVKSMTEYLKRVDKTEGRDFYYFNFTLKQDGIPVYSGKPFFYSDKADEHIIGTKGQAVYTEKGLEYICLTSFFKSGEPSEKVQIIDLCEAKNLLADKINSSVYESGVNVYDSQLVYLQYFTENEGGQSSEAVLKPAYMFNCRTKVTVDGTETTRNFDVFYDAVTGKELATAWQ